LISFAVVARLLVLASTVAAAELEVVALVPLVSEWA